MKIFFGTSITNDQKIEYSNTEVSQFLIDSLQIDKFSDGEILPCFKESIRDEDIFLIQSIFNSDLIVETMLIVDAAKRAGCKSFTLVAPFLPYSRQDKTDHLRSSIGSKMMADVLEKVGVTRVITIDLHASSIQGFYNIPVIHLNGNKVFIDYIRTLNLDNMCIVAPDQGAVKRASDFCKAFPEACFAMINKKRIKPNEIHSMELVGDVTGKNIIIVDDMADTLGTMRKAADLLIEKGAISVRAVATHGVLSGSAFKNLRESKITKFMVSNSIYKTSEGMGFADMSTFQGSVNSKGLGQLEYVSCAKLIAKSISAISQKKSINEINAV